MFKISGEMNRFSRLEVKTNELVGMFWSFYALFGDTLVFDVIFEINKKFFECNLFYILGDHMAKFNCLKYEVL